MTPTKPCRLCAQIKPLADFGASKSCADGHRHQCRACLKLRYKPRSREKNRIAAQRYRDKHREKYRAYQRKYHAVYDKLHPHPH